MSTQPASIIISRPPAWQREGTTLSDFQHLVDRVRAVLGRRCWLFAIMLLTGVFATLTVSLLLPRQYTVALQFERRDDAVISSLIQENSPYSFQALRPTIEADLKGDAAILEAIQQLHEAGGSSGDSETASSASGPDVHPHFLRELSQSVTIKLLDKNPGRDLIEVRYTGTDPRFGTRLVTALEQNYVRRARGRIQDILSRSHEFFAAQIAERQRKVAEI